MNKTETFIEKAIKIHGDKYDYSKVDYKKTDVKIFIICKIHGEFIQSPNKHLSGQGCRKCGLLSNSRLKSLNTSKFIEKAKIKHGDKYDYSKVIYKNCNEKVCIICKTHGEFNQNPSSHLCGIGCKICGINSNSKSRTITNNIFIDRAKIKHGDKYDYSKVDYKKSNMKVIIICKTHGEFMQAPKCHLRGQGCPKCAGNYLQTTDDFIEKAKIKHGDTYDYSKVIYNKTDEKICIICKTHGEFMQTPHGHLSGQGCPKCAGNYLHTTDDFIEKAKIKHGDEYDYSKVIYKNCNEKVCIICKTHGEFNQNPSSHLCGIGCKICGINSNSKSRTITNNIFIDRAKIKHGDKYDYSKVDYKKSNMKVIIICKTHGEFMQAPKCHLRGQGCPKCAGNYLQTTDDFIEKAKIKHGDTYDYSKVIYNKTDEKICIICKTHGEFMQTPHGHLSGQGCPKCAGNYLHTTDDFIEKAKIKHGDEYDYSKVIYKNCNEKVCIICKIHGEFMQKCSYHLSGSGCPKCYSRHSKMQIKWLNFISIYYGIYIQHAENDGEYQIPGSKYKADGYCLENNTIYEFHGDYWHGNPTLYDTKQVIHYGATFGELYEKTKKKENFIKENGYNIKIMWENDWKKINKNILKFQKIFKYKFL